MSASHNTTSIRQSTSHIMMCEPIRFYANPQTLVDNTYQSGDTADTIDQIQSRAVAEMRRLRDSLISRDVLVTTYRGQEGAPDDVFCNNWVSTDHDGSLIYYPLHVPNRRLERRADIQRFLESKYKLRADLTGYEEKGLALESTGSLCLDRINRIGYCALSARADLDVLQDWAKQADYELVAFNTQTENGKPVYHTNVMMFVGTGYIGLCPELIVPEDRERVLTKAQQFHTVIPITTGQIGQFCGNCLEVQSTSGGLYLVMSQRAYANFTDAQKQQFLQHVDDFVYADIATLEHFGGGSARCMLLELF